jgi:nitrate reductase gamma subunit
MSSKLGVERGTFLSELVESDSNVELLKKIYAFSCKSHKPEIEQSEAIFGYHLVLSTIYFLLLLYKDRARLTK